MRLGWLVGALLVSGCGAREDAPVAGVNADLTVSQKLPRYAGMRDAARARGIQNGYLLAGIANTETGLAHCWSEATWACEGPSSPDCGGGGVIAGAADGPCSDQQGGLGMFQFDAGTFDDTLNQYGAGVLTIDGQVAAAIDYVVHMVKISVYTTNAETDDKARAWINTFDYLDPTLEDQWVQTVLRYYNGCQPGWSCWSPRYQTYSDGLNDAVSDPGGLGFWADGGGTRCGDSPAVVGAIDGEYRALGGCSSVLGVPITEERPAPDGIGRYSVFQNGSIYWTSGTGAHEVHGVIRDKWAAVGWESGVLGYPTSDETPTPDGIGRFNHFQHGSIYWTSGTGAFEVHGTIHDAWAASGWETGPLGYPVSDEYGVPGGERSDFQRGSIVHDDSTGTTAIEQSSGSGGASGSGGVGGGGSSSGGAGGVAASGGAGGTDATGGTGGASSVGGSGGTVGGSADADGVAGSGGATGGATSDSPSSEHVAGCQVPAAPAHSNAWLALGGMSALSRLRRSRRAQPHATAPSVRTDGGP